MYIFIRNNAFQSCFADSKFHSFLPFNTCPVKIHKTQESETPTAISFEMYYFSCESFSWNYKLCITSEQLGPKFPNHESQTSLKHLIYLSVFSQVFFSSQPHAKHTLRVMVLLRGRWFPSKLALVSNSEIRLEWNQIRLRNLLVLVMFLWVIQ